MTEQRDHAIAEAPAERAYIEPVIRGQERAYGDKGKAMADPAANTLDPPGEGASKVHGHAIQGPSPQSKTQRRRF